MANPADARTQIVLPMSTCSSGSQTISSNKVLILTGGLITEKDTSLYQALRKQRMLSRYSKQAWLDIKLKSLTAEPLVSLKLESLLGARDDSLPNELKHRIFDAAVSTGTPGLTEIVLASLLSHYDIDFEIAQISQITSSKTIENSLSECDCVFFSTTYLHDLSEVKPLVERINKPHNHIVLGGALTSLIYPQWEAIEGVEVLAVGYGELLVPSLVRWIKSGYTHLDAPPSGSLQDRNSTYLLFSGSPESKILDFLPRTDWKIAAQYYRKPLKMIYYESVRGCPYNCSFCNYPYLFDDNKFRHLSAERMAADWEYYVNELNVEYITCLDSLFTMPKRRLTAFCNLLITRDIKVKWICYARADDLADENVVKLMKRAGAHQVQIGIESGHQALLDNMNKRCTVEANARAIKNCRKHGLTTVVSLIVGFPGETAETLEATYEFLKAAPPDFYYLAAFSTRSPNIPILNDVNRQRFKLHNANSAYTMAPYWQHDSMNCVEATDHIRTLNRRLMYDEVSLNAVLLYSGLLNYRAEDREQLLAYQKRVVNRHPVIRSLFTLMNKWINRQMSKDIRRCLPCTTAFTESAENTVT
jgi:radical SAM superfamily enzyme YgiQ (UPF0313 family)